MQRKLISLLLFCLLIVFTVNQVEARPSYKQDFARSAAESKHPERWHGCVGAWVPSLGITGDTMFDISGYGIHGDFQTANVTWDTNDKGHVVSVSGDDNAYVEFSNPRWNLASKGTVVFKARFNGSSAGGFPAFASQTSGDETFYCWAFVSSDSNPATGSIHLRGLDASDTELFSMIGTTAPFDQEWHFLAGTWDGSTAKLYEDWLAPVTDTYAGLVDCNPGSDMALSRLQTVSRELGADYEYCFIFDRALSAGEIAKLQINPLAMFELRRPVFRAPDAAPAAPAGSRSAPQIIISQK